MALRWTGSQLEKQVKWMADEWGKLVFKEFIYRLWILKCAAKNRWNGCFIRILKAVIKWMWSNIRQGEIKFWSRKFTGFLIRCEDEDEDDDVASKLMLWQTAELVVLCVLCVWFTFYKNHATSPILQVSWKPSEGQPKKEAYADLSQDSHQRYSLTVEDTIVYAQKRGRECQLAAD